MSVWKLVASDYRANKNNWKGFTVLFLYRLAHAHLTAPFLIKPFSFLYLVFYKILMELFMGTEIHWRTTIGKGAVLYHGYGLVIHSDAVIGDNIILRHGTTIGMKYVNGSICAPVIGDNVDIGVSALIIGKINIGDYAIIGAGSVVVKDVPKGSVVVGNPARIIKGGL